MVAAADIKQQEQEAHVHHLPPSHDLDGVHDHPSSSPSPRIYPITEGIQSIKSQQTYERCFKSFLNHIKIHDLQVLLDFSPKVIKQMVVDYILYLRDTKNLSRASIKVHLGAILHFFQINNDDFHLTTRNFKIHLPPHNETRFRDRHYTREEIAKIINHCDLRNRVIILLLVSTGMRIGALHSLQVGHLVSVSSVVVSTTTTTTTTTTADSYRIRVYAGTREEYHAFCTLECANAIREYLDYRKRSGETILNKSPLIREQFNVNDHIRIQYPRFVSEKRMEHLIDNVLRKSGTRKPKEVHLSHGFRKFFMTTCEQSGMRSINVKILLGHDIGVSGHYYRPAESDVLNDYMAHAANVLTIDPTKRLEKENQELKNGYLAELGDLRHDFNEMKRLLVHLSKGSQKELVDEFFQKVGDKADIEWSCDN
jgi:integrase